VALSAWEVARQLLLLLWVPLVMVGVVVVLVLVGVPRSMAVSTMGPLVPVLLSALVQEVLLVLLVLMVLLGLGLGLLR
jgi:hypothetical protein